MAKPSRGEGSADGGDARTAALTEEFGGQLRRMGGAGAKITQLLSMVQLERTEQGERSAHPLGSMPEDREPSAWRRVKGVIEHDLDARIHDVFADFEEEPFAIASLGQVHSARTRAGEQVAVKVQHPDVGDAIAGELRNVRLVSPILKRLAPGSDAGALLSEVRADSGGCSVVILSRRASRRDRVPISSTGALPASARARAVADRRL